MEAKAIVVPRECKVILSDKLLDALGTEIVKAGTGYWRFNGEPVNYILGRLTLL